MPVIKPIVKSANPSVTAENVIRSRRSKLANAGPETAALTAKPPRSQQIKRPHRPGDRKSKRPAVCANTMHPRPRSIDIFLRLGLAENRSRNEQQNHNRHDHPVKPAKRFGELHVKRKTRQQNGKPKKRLKIIFKRKPRARSPRRRVPRLTRQAKAAPKHQAPLGARAQRSRFFPKPSQRKRHPARKQQDREKENMKLRSRWHVNRINKRLSRNLRCFCLSQFHSASSPCCCKCSMASSEASSRKINRRVSNRPTRQFNPWSKQLHRTRHRDIFGIQVFRSRSRTTPASAGDPPAETVSIISPIRSAAGVEKSL